MRYNGSFKNEPTIHLKGEAQMSANECNLLRMKELIDKLKEADVAYYRDDSPIMSDREYDELTTELQQLESKTGVILSGFPTQRVSGEILESLTPVPHTRPMLSARRPKMLKHW